MIQKTAIGDNMYDVVMVHIYSSVDPYGHRSILPQSQLFTLALPPMSIYHSISLLIEAIPADVVWIKGTSAVRLIDSEVI